MVALCLTSILLRRHRPETPPLTGFNYFPDLDIAQSRRGQDQQDRLTAQKQQQAGRASGSLSLRSSPEQTEPGGPQQSDALSHQQAQQYTQMAVQSQQVIAMRDAQYDAANKDALPLRTAPLLSSGPGFPHNYRNSWRADRDRDRDFDRRERRPTPPMRSLVVEQQAHQNFMKDNSNGLLPSPSSFYPEWGFGRDSNMLPSPLTFQTPVDPNGPSFARDNSAERKRKTSDQRNMPVQPNDERCVSPRTFKNTRIFCSVYSLPQGKVQSTISEDHTTNASKRRKLNFMALGQSNSYGATTKQHSRRDAEPNGHMSALIRA